jgi:hypothetical protein
VLVHTPTHTQEFLCVRKWIVELLVQSSRSFPDPEGSSESCKKFLRILKSLINPEKSFCELFEIFPDPERFSTFSRFFPEFFWKIDL